MAPPALCNRDSSELTRRRRLANQSLCQHQYRSTTSHPLFKDPLYTLQQPVHTQNFTMDRLSRMLAAAQGMGGMGGGPAQDTNLIDNSETVYISSLALLKMLRHGCAYGGHGSDVGRVCR
jgi:hypothetical protein